MMNRKDYPRVAIIGAGVSGITMAISLKEQLGIETFTMYDRNADCGGTWMENTYPGCACDIPTALYSRASDLNPNWSRTCPPQKEIQAYWAGIIRKHRLLSHTRYLTELIRAIWLPASNKWLLTFHDLTPGAEAKFDEQVDVLISAVGQLSKPWDKTKSLPGLETFTGPSFHSSRWDHSVELKGKRVAIIGNGSSASQIVPAISLDPSTTVTNFVRSSQWYLPFPFEQFTDRTKWLYAHVPGLMRWFRYKILLGGDVAVFAFVTNNRWLRRIVEKQSIQYTKSAPLKYRDFLVPKYPLGTKRIIFDAGYIPALSRPNVELVWEGIEHVTRTGVRLKNGEERELDVIVVATGFNTQMFLSAVEVRGREGQLLSEVWAAEGGPQAYYGSCIAGFPNLLTIYGPNTATGHTSVLFFSECQVKWQTQVLKRLIQTRALFFDVKPEAEHAYNRWVHAMLAKMVWASDKTGNWYRMPGGKIHALWPGSSTYFWWVTRKPIWRDFEFVGAKRSALSMLKMMNWAVVAAAAAAVAWYQVKGKSLNWSNIGSMIQRIIWQTWRTRSVN